MMENKSIGNRGMGINYKGSQGQTKRAVVLQEEEEDIYGIHVYHTMYTILTSKILSIIHF
jgi:hypothetical protein